MTIAHRWSANLLAGITKHERELAQAHSIGTQTEIITSQLLLAQLQNTYSLAAANDIQDISKDIAKTLTRVALLITIGKLMGVPLDTSKAAATIEEINTMSQRTDALVEDASNLLAQFQPIVHSSRSTMDKTFSESKRSELIADCAKQKQQADELLESADRLKKVIGEVQEELSVTVANLT